MFGSPMLSTTMLADVSDAAMALSSRLYPAFWWTAQNLVVAALLAGGVWLVCRTVRVGPVVRHALWLLVLAKLLTPPLVAWPWAGGEPLRLTGVADAPPAPVARAAVRPIAPPSVAPTEFAF